MDLASWASRKGRERDKAGWKARRANGRENGVYSRRRNRGRRERRKRICSPRRSIRRYSKYVNRCTERAKDAGACESTELKSPTWWVCPSFRILLRGHRVLLSSATRRESRVYGISEGFCHCISLCRALQRETKAYDKSAARPSRIRKWKSMSIISFLNTRMSLNQRDFHLCECRSQINIWHFKIYHKKIKIIILKFSFFLMEVSTIYSTIFLVEFWLRLYLSYIFFLYIFLKKNLIF